MIICIDILLIQIMMNPEELLSFKQLTVGIIQYPGSNCAQDIKNYFPNSVYLFHTEESLPKDIQLIILPGGFAFGDRVYEKATLSHVFNPGKMAILSPVTNLLLEAKYIIEKSGLQGQNECLEKCSRFPNLKYVYYNDKDGSSKCECKTKSSNIAGNPQDPEQNWKMIQKTRKN